MENLHLKVKAAAVELIELAGKQGLELVVVNSLRSEEEQLAMYTQGRKSLDLVNKLRFKAKLPFLLNTDNKWTTNAKKAAHTYHGYGLAFDVALVLDNKVVHASKKVDWADPKLSPWLVIGRLSKQINGLEWGGTFSASPDVAHYQMTFGLTITDLLNGIRP